MALSGLPDWTNRVGPPFCLCPSPGRRWRPLVDYTRRNFRITVEDSAFLAVEMMIDTIEGVQYIQFRTNLDEVVKLDEHHPLWIKIDPDTDQPRPYIVMEGQFDARLTRSVFYELVDNGVEQSIDGEHIYGVWSNNSFFPIYPDSLSSRKSLAKPIGMDSCRYYDCIWLFKHNGTERTDRVGS